MDQNGAKLGRKSGFRTFVAELVVGMGLKIDTDLPVMICELLQKTACQ